MPENLKGKEITVYYINSKGEKEEHIATVKDGYATFETDHFSTYVLAENNITIADTNDKEKDNLYKNYSIYLANSQNEPFGITSLEATSNNCLVLGKNEGGTPEIIKNGINGYLYSNINEARKILKQILKS